MGGTGLEYHPLLGAYGLIGVSEERSLSIVSMVYIRGMVSIESHLWG